MFGTVSLTFVCLYLPRILYALPSPQQSATLVFFGLDSGFDDDDDIAFTQFLVPIGTASDDTQTTFDFVEIDSSVIESISGTATVTQTTLSTFTAELVASASGFALDATVTASSSGIVAEATVSEGCHIIASDTGECVAAINGVTGTVSGAASTQIFSISGAPTSSGGGSATSTSGPKKNSGFSHHSDQKMLAGLAFGTTILGICSGRFLLL